MGMMISPRRSLRICSEVESEIELEHELAFVVWGGKMAGLIYPLSPQIQRRYDDGAGAAAGRALRSSEEASGGYWEAGGPRGWVCMWAGTTPEGVGGRRPLLYHREFDRRGGWGSSRGQPGELRVRDVSFIKACQRNIEFSDVL